ncbi:MAG: hypothetical protein RJB39_737 [Candidatus Parcubacteria bacterium]|jgi:hypothetical protein
MKWIAIAGGWKKTNEQIRRDVQSVVKQIIHDGNGIVSGGALGVDLFATDVVLKENGQMKIFIPSTLDIYRAHYFQRAAEGIITPEQATELIAQLEEVKKRGFLLEGNESILNREAYFNRITKIIETADELVAFHINNGDGTTDTITKAEAKGIPIKKFVYTLE